MAGPEPARRIGAGSVALLLLSPILLGSGATHAAPYRPQDDAQVLERLPASRPAAPSRALTPDLAARLARVYIERARATGDLRQLGYARGVLAPWWNAGDAPDPVLLMRATLRQSSHDFVGALSDLDRLLQRKPDDAQAQLTLATILRVQGRYAEALDACLALRDSANAFVATLCEQSLRGLQGDANAAAALDWLRPRLAQQPPAVAAWYYAERAELAARSGEAAQAERLYREALQAHPDDLDLRACFADLLLDTGRAAEARDLIPADTAVDALRLRRALALHALADPAFVPLDADIRAGFAAAQRRGESLHLREEARYTLAVPRDAGRALQLALRNWAVQREAWDARLLIEAAAAAGDPAAAEPVREWMRASGYTDARLERRP